MKIAIIIGHNEKSKGYFSKHLNVYEWDFYNDLVQDLECIGDVYFHDSSINSYEKRCEDISERIGKKYDLSIALHFNSFNGKAGGTEVFYWHSNKETKEIATFLSDEFSSRSGLANRGAKAYKTAKQRGAGEVFKPKINAILFEPFFGDNKTDCDKWDKEIFINCLKGIKNECFKN